MTHTRSLLLAFAMLFAGALWAQNPIIRNQFTADPTARVFNNRVYLFPSHDIPAPSDYPRKDWFCMADYHVFSSENLADWTDHGVIVDQKNVPWGNPAGYSMWAPDCIQKDGKYYFFFPDAPKEGRGFGIGVAVADRPEGPYVVRDKKIEGLFGIDPVVLQTSKGETYIFWAGGRILGAKLNDDLTAIEGKPVEVSAPCPQGFKEGPFVFEREGLYYLTYPWVEDKTETLAYAVSHNPLGPYTFMGKIMEQSPTGCWTNHHSIVEYNNQWYLFYHHNDYSPHFDKLRAARVDSLFFNKDGSIRPVVPTLRGVGNSSARSLIQVDRYSQISPEGASIEFLYDAINHDSIVAKDGELWRGFEGWQLSLKGQKAYSTYNNVDFGTTSPSTITARVKAPKGGLLRVKIDGERTIAIINIPANEAFVELSYPLIHNVCGIKNLRLEAESDDVVSIDWITFDRTQDVVPLNIALPDPLAFANGKGRAVTLKEWPKRRSEIASLIQKNEIGTIPTVKKKDIKARMVGDTLYVDVFRGKKSITLSATINYPKDSAALAQSSGIYPLMIGTSHLSLPYGIFSHRPIATLNYNERQVNGYSQFHGETDKSTYGFVKLYPELADNGAYSEWAWGLSRIIDALEILGPAVTHIDTKHIGVSGCSYAGKMALFCGAFDERVALTIAQEPGGGGAASWRVSRTIGGVEDLDHTDYHWFKETMREQFGGDKVFTMPTDHHELCALVCPRALLILGNTDYHWLADESAYVSANAARKVWQQYGVADRMGYSILGGHPHCMLPKSQYSEVEAFIDRFLLEKDVDTDNILIAPDFQHSVNLKPFIGF